MQERFHHPPRLEGACLMRFAEGPASDAHFTRKPWWELLLAEVCGRKTQMAFRNTIRRRRAHSIRAKGRVSDTFDNLPGGGTRTERGSRRLSLKTGGESVLSSA